MGSHVKYWTFTVVQCIILFFWATLRVVKVFVAVRKINVAVFDQRFVKQFCQMSFGGLISCNSIPVSLTSLVLSLLLLPSGCFRGTCLLSGLEPSLSPNREYFLKIFVNEEGWVFCTSGRVITARIC